MQLAAYAMAHDYIYHTSIDKAVIMMCSVDNYYQEWIISGKQLRHYKYEFLRRLNDYYVSKGQLLKWFLVGWLCLGQGLEQSCVRMASSIIHPSVEECQQFYKVVYQELSDLDGYVSLDFHCVQAAVVEDYLQFCTSGVSNKQFFLAYFLLKTFDERK